MIVDPDAALGRGEGRRSGIRGPVPGTHGLRAGARDGRSVERSDDDLLQRHEILRDASRRRSVSRHPTGTGARRVEEGPQAYGRTARTMRASRGVLAKEIGRPVRVQWMRNEETGWDTKGPAFTFKIRGGLDAQGNLVALDYDARAADYCHLGYNEVETVLIAQLMGMRRATPAAGNAGAPSDMYAIANRRTASQIVSMPLVWETPLRTGNLRDPNGPQITFAAESFIDEMAAAAKADPLEFGCGAHRWHHGGQRVQAGAFHRRSQSGGGGLRWARSFTETLVNATILTGAE